VLTGYPTPALSDSFLTPEPGSNIDRSRWTCTVKNDIVPADTVYTFSCKPGIAIMPQDPRVHLLIEAGEISLLVDVVYGAVILVNGECEMRRYDYGGIEKRAG
jgi:hypothetical protein